MDLQRISEMVETVCRSDSVTELTLRDGPTRLTVRRRAPVAVDRPTGPAAPAAPQAPEMYSVRSPLVGIFHSRASEAQDVITVGATVRKGQILGAIESMRMLYEVAAEVTGTVVEIPVDEAQSVEYGQELFRIQLAPDTHEVAP